MCVGGSECVCGSGQEKLGREKPAAAEEEGVNARSFDRPFGLTATKP